MKTNRRGFTLVEIMIVVTIIGLLAALAIPAFARARITTQRNVCMNNLRQIDSAKHQWALETNQAPTALPTFNNLIGFIKGDTRHVWCPADPNTSFETSYQLNAMEENPTCRIAAATHVLR